MQADPDERISQRTGRSGPPVVPVLAGIVLVAALGVWVFTGEEQAPPAPQPAPIMDAEPESAPAPDPVPERLPETAPDIPPAPVAEAAAEPEAPAPEPPLALDASDEPVRQELTGILAPELLPVLDNSDLLERGVALIDGMSRGVMRTKVLPLAPPAGKFTTRKTDGQDYMDPAGYDRYDSYARAVEALDTAALVSSFHEFRPLLEQAYGLLGYKPENFDNAVIQSLDILIATPVFEEPLPVKKVEAIYKFTDAELEKLPDLQKQLLRMGPDNTRRIQAQARILRDALLQPQSPQPR